MEKIVLGLDRSRTTSSHMTAGVTILEVSNFKNPKVFKMVFVASLLSTRHLKGKNKETGLVGPVVTGGSHVW